MNDGYRITRAEKNETMLSSIFFSIFPSLDLPSVSFLRLPSHLFNGNSICWNSCNILGLQPVLHKRGRKKSGMAKAENCEKHKQNRNHLISVQRSHITTKFHLIFFPLCLPLFPFFAIVCATDVIKINFYFALTYQIIEEFKKWRKKRFLFTVVGWMLFLLFFSLVLVSQWNLLERFSI